MKKGTTNKKVLQAITIGLSTMISVTSMPIQAMAAEGDTESTPEGNVSTTNTNSTVCDNAQEKTETALTEIGTGNAPAVQAPETKETPDTTTDASAFDAVKGVEDKITEGTDKVVAGEAGIVENADGTKTDLSQAVLDAAAGLDDKQQPSETVAKDGEEQIQQAYDDVKGAEGNLVAAEAADTNATMQQGAAETAVNNANTAAGNMTQINSQATTDSAAEIEAMRGATTVEGANNAYNALQNTLNTAEAAIDAQLNVYNQNKTALETALEEKAKAEETYKTQISTASTSATAAYNELKAAEEKVAALETALGEAEKGIAEKYKAALEIADAETLTQNDGPKVNWINQDKLFEKVMLNYYIPGKIEDYGSDAKVTAVRNNTVQYSDAYHFFEVTYKDKEGKTKTKYFDFKMEKGSLDNIVIYEERETAANYSKDLLAQQKDPNAAPTVGKDDYDNYTAIDKDGNTVKLNGDSEGVKYDAANKTLKQAIEDGEVVEINGKYIYLNEGSTSTLFAENSTVTSTDKLTETVTGAYSEPIYKLDTNGNVVKEVTADVTTITYAKDSLVNSSQDVTDMTVNEQNAAAKKAELEATKGIKDVTVTLNSGEKTVQDASTYQASGYYIPTFTQKVDITHEEDWGSVDFWNYDKDVNVAKSQAKNEAKEKLEDKENIKDGGMYLIPNSIVYDSVSEKIVTDSNSGKILGIRYDNPDDYEIKVSATATYAKVTKTEVKLSIFDSILSSLGLSNTKDNAKAAAKQWVSDQYGVYLDLASWNWDLGTADVFYLKAEKVTGSADCTSAEAAKASAEEAAKKAGGYNYQAAKEAPVETKHSHQETYYNYSIDYLKESSRSAENKVVEITTYEDANAVKGTVVQNLNYNNGKYVFEQTKDQAYRNFVDTAKNAANKYSQLKTETANAKAEVVEAEEAVIALQNELVTLQSKYTQVDKVNTLLKWMRYADGVEAGTITPTVTEGEESQPFNYVATLEGIQTEWQNQLDQLTADLNRADLTAEEKTALENRQTELKDVKDILDKLIEAEKGKQTAQSTLAELMTQLETAGEELTEIVDRLTPPATAPTTPGEGGETPGGGAAPTADAPAAPGAPAALPVAAPAAQGQVLGVQRELGTSGQRAGSAARTALKNQLSKATGAEDLSDEEKEEIVAELEQQEKDKEIVTIENEDVALADSIDKDSIGWWWWLLILVFGAAGYAMYRKHMQKKKAAEGIEPEDK